MQITKLVRAEYRGPCEVHDVPEDQLARLQAAKVLEEAAEVARELLAEQPDYERLAEELGDLQSVLQAISVDLRLVPVVAARRVRKVRERGDWLPWSCISYEQRPHNSLAEVAGIQFEVPPPATAEHRYYPHQLFYDGAGWTPADWEQAFAGRESLTVAELAELRPSLPAPLLWLAALLSSGPHVAAASRRMRCRAVERRLLSAPEDGIRGWAQAYLAGERPVQQPWDEQQHSCCALELQVISAVLTPDALLAAQSLRGLEWGYGGAAAAAVELDAQLADLTAELAAC